jgi:large subunit ribosomal protein L9
MRVILLENVEFLGQKGDIKEVKPGFWRNFLMPRNLAKIATPALVQKIEKEKAEILEKKRKAEEALKKALKELEGKSLKVKEPADEKNNLFSGVDQKKISGYLKEKLKLDIPPDLIQIEKPIKKAGVYAVPLKNGSFELKIEPVFSKTKKTKR